MKHFGCFALDTANLRLLCGGAPIELPPKLFAMLRFLVEHPGRLISHDELLDSLWADIYVQPQVLRTYVLELRKILGDDAAHPRFIQTLPKRGFRFIADVTDHETSAIRATAHEVAPALVDRNRELAFLQNEWNLATAGQRRVVFLTGEAGIGKTALVDEFCRRIDPANAIIARGHCVQGFAGREEFYPLLETLGQLCSGHDGEIASKILRRIAPAWMAQESSIHLEPQDTESESGQRHFDLQRTTGSLCEGFEALSANKPLILILEDLSWADESTLRFVSALARRTSPARVLLLATVCPQTSGCDDAARALRQDLILRQLATEHALAPLSRHGVGNLLSRELKDLPSDIVDFVVRRSEGNPLFVLAMADHLVSQGHLARSCVDGEIIWIRASEWPEIESDVPTQLARVIELEIDKLSEADRHLLEAGSLMDVAFPAWAVAAALEREALDVEEACDALARRLHFVVRAGEDELPDGSISAFYAFGHRLYRDVLYRRQASGRRARRHARIAARLAEMFVGREADVARELAFHLSAGGENVRPRTLLQPASFQS